MAPCLSGGSTAAAALLWAMSVGDLPDATAIFSTALNVRKRFWRPSGTLPNVLRIGTPITLDSAGKYSAMGKHMCNAWEMYFDWLNDERSGVNVSGTLYSVELVLIDDESSKDRVEWATEYLLQQEGIEHFLAPYSSGLTGRMAPIVEAAGKVMVAPGSSLTSVFENRSHVFGTLTPTRAFLTGAMEAVGAAKNSSRKSVMYVAEDTGFTLAACAEVPRLAQLHNMDLLTGQILIPANAGIVEATSAVEALKQRKPDVVVSCTYSITCHAILDLMKILRYMPKALISTICVGTDNFLRDAGIAGRYTTGVSPWISSLQLSGPITYDWTAGSFAREYVRRYGDPPPYQAASAFVAAATLVYAIESAGTLDPASVADTIRSMDEDSMYGRIRFDANGQCTNSIKVLQYQHDDGLRAVFPAGVASSELVYPKPDWATLQCLKHDAESRFGFMDHVCVECPAGRTSVVAQADTGAGGVSFRYCAACPEGRFGLYQPIQRCIDCTPGTFQSRQGATACSFSPPGSFCNASRMSECEHCPLGRMAESVGSSYCTECAAGYYQDAPGSTACQRCEVGRFGENRASTACEDCPGNFLTHGTGFSQASDCGCPPGRFNSSQYDASRSPSCEPCPEGVNCPGFAEAPSLLPGYYEAAEAFNPFNGVWYCRPAHACPGGPPGSCTDRLEGIGCSLCPDGQVNSEGRRCRDCDAANSLFFGFLPLAMAAALVLLYYFTNDTISIFTNTMLGASITVGISITTVQVLGMLGQLMIPWPQSIESIMESCKVFVSDGNAISLECMVGREPAAKYFTMFMLPFIVIISLAILTLISVGVSHLTRKRLEVWRPYKVFNTLFHMGQAIFITITVIAAWPMQCYSHPNGKWTMVSSPSVLCWEGDATHTQFLLMGFSLLLFIVLPFLSISVWGSYSVYVGSRMYGENAPQLTMYRYLIYKYRADVWWWGNVYNLRQLLLGLTPLVTPDDTANQIVYVLFIVIVYLAVVTCFFPWRTIELNLFDMLTTGFITFVGICLSTFIPLSQYEGRRTSLLVAMVVVTLLLLIIAGCYAIVEFYRHGRKGRFGYQFPREEDMFKFADTVHAILKLTADLSLEQTRTLVQEMTTFDRLKISAVVTMLKSTSQLSQMSYLKRSSTLAGTFNKTLRMVAPATEEEIVRRNSADPDTSAGTEEASAADNC